MTVILTLPVMAAAVIVFFLRRMQQGGGRVFSLRRSRAKLAHLLPEADPLHKVTILPRGRVMSGGLR